MSFMHHFKLSELAVHAPLPPHLMGSTSFSANPGPPPAAQGNSFPPNPSNPPTFSSTSGSKQPYGSGDTDDGYTLIFPNLDAFNAWREKEEIEQMVEFVKGDTHGSKAVPPRFKDHTKLVCARHSRSGRKKYVKKHPERVRKVPSRKLEGTGCSASISFKTYFDVEEVRACYNSQHAHPIGPENFPFTRRGRKAAVQQEKERPRKYQKKDDATPTPVPEMPNPQQPVASTSYIQQQQHQSVQQQPQQQQVQVQMPQPGPPNQFMSNVSMIAPLPQHGHAIPQYQPQPQIPYGYAPQYPGPMPMPDASAITQDRWQNMATLFNAIREHSRGFNYPPASVVALESVLIRLFLESPVSLQTSMAPNGAPVSMNGPVTSSSNNDNGEGQDSESEGSEDN